MIGTHLSGLCLPTRRWTQDHRGGRRLLRPPTHTQAKYHQPHRSGGGCKPAYGRLGREIRRGHWSAGAGGLVAFRRTDDGGRTTGGTRHWGGWLNTQKRAERGHIGRKERGDGQDVLVGARSPDESWRGEKEGTKSSLTGKHRNLLLRGHSLETTLAYALGKESTPQ